MSPSHFLLSQYGPKTMTDDQIALKISDKANDELKIIIADKELEIRNLNKRIEELERKLQSIYGSLR